jgi:hypothetical protein
MNEDAKKHQTPKDGDENVVRFPEQSVPPDADDISRLFDSEIGDAITEPVHNSITAKKPKDFFRTHPDKAYRPQTEIYTHKPEGVIDEQHYIVDPAMRGRIEEARPCTLVTVVDRDGVPRLWPIPLPREGERDNDAWKSARAAARAGLGRWVKLVWAKRAYKTREAQSGYAPDPDWGKVPPFAELVRIAFGENGIIRNEQHPVYRELFGATPGSDNDADI